MKAMSVSKYPKFPIICEPREIWSQIYTGLKGSHQPEFVIDLKLSIEEELDDEYQLELAEYVGD